MAIREQPQRRLRSKRVLHATLRERSVNPVTRLPIRAELIRHISRHLRLPQQEGRIDPKKLRDFALIHLDTNNLHTLNHLADHEGGNEGLRMVGKTIRRIAGENGGRAYHLGSGGDEFVVFLPFSHRGRVQRLQNDIIREVERQVREHNNPAFREARFGVRTGFATYSSKDSVSAESPHHPLPAFANILPEKQAFLTRIISIPDRFLNDPRRGARENLASAVARLFAGRRAVTEREVLNAIGGTHFSIDAYGKLKQRMQERAK